MNQLIWKELREQRYIPVACGALVASLIAIWYAVSLWSTDRHYGALMSANDAGEVLLIVFCLLGIFSGSGAFASENGNGTIGFLTTLPLGRPRIWFGKVAAGIIIITLSMAAVFTMYAAIVAVVFGSDALTQQISTQWWPVTLMSICAVYGYAVCLFVSTVVDRTLVAVTAGLILALAVFAAFGYWSILVQFRTVHEYDGAVITIGTVIVLAAAFLAGSYTFFCSGAPLQTGNRIKRSSLALFFGALIAVLWLTVWGAVEVRAYRAQTAALQASCPQLAFGINDVSNDYCWGTAKYRIVFPSRGGVTEFKSAVILNNAAEPNRTNILPPLHMPRNPRVDSPPGNLASTKDSDAFVASKIMSGGVILISVTKHPLPGAYHDSVNVLGKNGETLAKIYVENVTP